MHGLHIGIEVPGEFAERKLPLGQLFECIELVPMPGKQLDIDVVGQGVGEPGGDGGVYLRCLDIVLHLVHREEIIHDEIEQRPAQQQEAQHDMALEKHDEIEGDAQHHGIEIP